MPIHAVRALSLTVLAMVLLPSISAAQWLKEPTSGIPRTADGKANLSAPSPRLANGKPDLSGLWNAARKFDTDFKTGDAMPWAEAIHKQRQDNPAADSWSTLCLPPGPMIAFSGPLKIVHTPQAVTVLYEVPNNFRQIFMDGRSLPVDPNPTYQGYSVGRWDGDTLVVETIGFNDRSMVGRPAYPHTEALRLTERYRRRDFGHIDLQTTVDDPKTFTRVWSFTIELEFDPDTELIEYVCNENEKDRQHFVRPSANSTAEVHVDPAVLVKYAGVYEVMTPRGVAKATLSVDDDQLMVNVPGFGNGRAVPQSPTMFQFRGAVIEFMPDERGEVTYLVIHAVEGAFKGPRLEGPPKP